MKTELGLALALWATVSTAQDRIGARVVSGEGEFYNTASGERFRPFGVNYLEFRSVGYYREDRLLQVGRFDHDVVARDFQLLRSHGYDTVRVFFDHCSIGAGCIVAPDQPGLNPEYLDNLAALTRIAAAEGIYLVLTSNDIPDHGGYGELANREASALVGGYRNAHFMTKSGVAAFEAYWTDIMAALAARETAWPAVLGWSILNEQWIFKDQPPWSLTSGEFVNGTGSVYDLSDPAQKRAALADNLMLISTRVRDIVKATDPEALVGMGFFVPQFPNPTDIGGDWYVDTEPLLAGAPLDFYDFHAYVDSGLALRPTAENYGMDRHPDKPVLMGEVGSSSFFIPRAQTALRLEQEWIAESCDLGWDGWLHWGFEPFPAGVDNHPPYTLTGDDGLFLRGLSPVERPDPCFDGGYEPHLNLAFDATARASRSLPERGPELALDGKEAGWESGDDPPGWIEVTLAQPSALAEITLWLAQWPEGETRTRVTATLADGSRVLIADRRGVTAEGQKLRFAWAGGLEEAVSVRVEIPQGPSWVALHDIELLRHTDTVGSCRLQARSAANLRAGPSTENPVVGRLSQGWQTLAASVTAPDSAAHRWFQTPDGSYLREDVVTATGTCEVLPQSR